MSSNRKLNLVLVDYQLGNIFSVRHACEKLGYSASISSDPDEIYKADAIILPGVGAFKTAMDNLAANDLIEAICDFVSLGKPLMGVCLGMQLLFESSEEFGDSKGLGLIHGNVKKFQTDIHANVKVPQIGWNSISPPDEDLNVWKNTPFSDFNENTFMYFVHSYFVSPENKSLTLAQTIYHQTIYCSAIISNNIFAVQFHPEKSGIEGLKIYDNWLTNL